MGSVRRWVQRQYDRWDHAGPGNLITDNGGPGVAVTGDSSVGNQITANRIFGNTGQAIDLGDDGVTDNSTAPRQGPNNLQNFPIIGRTADAQLEGWLGGSLPDTTFRIDVFASAGYGPGGAGEAQDDLGSLEVTTDPNGQATSLFLSRHLAPAGHHGHGDRSDWQHPKSCRAPGRTGGSEADDPPGPRQPVSRRPGDGIAPQDPDAGRADAIWNLTLSAWRHADVIGRPPADRPGDGTDAIL